jgi:hypothetical protein
VNSDPPSYASRIAGKIGVYHHTQLLLVEMGFGKLLAQASLKLQSSPYLPSR